jgi:hypothetical protein
VLLPDLFAAPRICLLDDQLLWIKPLDGEGWGILLGWLDDFIPGKDERPGLPRFDSPEAQALLLEPHGQALLAWLALRRLGYSYVAASTLWEKAEPLQRAKVRNVLFSHRKTFEPPETPDDSDISQCWASKGMAALAREIGLEELGRLSLDQIAWLLSGGELDADPRYSRQNLAKRIAEWKANELQFVLDNKDKAIPLDRMPMPGQVPPRYEKNMPEILKYIADHEQAEQGGDDGD